MPSAARPRAPIPDPAAIAPGDADGWRARLQALAARDGLCATLGITVLAGGPGRCGGGDDGRARAISTSTAAATAARSSRSPTAPSAWRRTRTARSPRGSTRTSPTRPASRAGDRLVARATEVQRSRRIARLPDRRRPARSRAAARRRCRASPARSRSRPDRGAPAEGYTRGCCPVDCHQNDNLASKFSYSRDRRAAARARLPSFERLNVSADLPSPPARACRRAVPTRRRCARRSSASGRRSAGASSRRSSEAMACGLAEAGLKRGQHLVVIGENRPRLYAAMLAAQALGAIPVPLYQDAAASEFVFPIAQCRGRLRRSSRTRSRSTR